jgi:hypothetical protein
MFGENVVDKYASAVTKNLSLVCNSWPWSNRPFSYDVVWVEISTLPYPLDNNAGRAIPQTLSIE